MEKNKGASQGSKGTGLFGFFKKTKTKTGAKYKHIIMPPQGDGNCYANFAMSATSNLLKASKQKKKMFIDVEERGK